MRCDNQQAVIVATAALWLAWACELSVLVVHADKAWGASPGQIGTVFAVAWSVQMLGTPVGGWLADRLGRKQVIVGSFSAACVAMASLALSQSLETFLISLTAWSFLSSLMMPALSAFAIDISTEPNRGAALSLHRQASDVVWLAGPVGLGMLADLTSTSVAVGFTGAFGLASTLFFALKAKDTKTFT